MAPSWLPQNIQKRIFRYILARLEVFSDLDLSNLDVSVGTKTNLTLRDVELDTDKFSLPNGVFVRSGKLGTLNLSIGVGNSGVQVDGTDLEFTVALSSNSLDEDDLSDLLTRTTADLAESLLIGDHSGDSSVIPGNGSDSDDSSNYTTGYGFGELPNVISKVADAALSQLSIMLHSVRLKLIIDEESNLEIFISKIQLSTGKDNLRTFKVSDIEIMTPDDPAKVEEEESSDEIDDSDDHFNTNEMQNSLMQSTLFSHEQASTMYMSAMSSIMKSKSEETHSLRLLWCSYAELSFKGLLKSDFALKVGSVKISIEPLSRILGTFVRFIREFEENSRKAESIKRQEQFQSKVNEPGEENDDLLNDRTSFTLEASVNELHIGTSKLLPDGLFESEENVIFEISLIRLNIDSQQQLLSVSNLSLRKGQTSLFWFRKKESYDEDVLICHLGDKITLLLPFPASFDFDIDSLLEMQKFILPFLQLSTPQASSSSSNGLSPLSRQYQISAKFNIIEGNVGTGSTVIHASIFPSIFKNGKWQVNRVTISIDPVGNIKSESGTVTIEGISFVLGNASSQTLSTIVKSVESSDNISVVVLSRLDVSIVKIDLNQTLLDLLVGDSKKLYTRSNSISTPVLPSPPKQVRIKEHEVVNFSTFITKVDCRFTFSADTPLGQFHVDAGNIELNLLNSGCTQISISTLFVSRDFSDLDPTQSHIALIYNANPSQKTQPMVYIEIKDGKPVDTRFYNFGLYYHVRLLDLFDNGSTVEVESDEIINNSALDDSIATIKDHNKELKLQILLRDCVVELNPLSFDSRALFVVKDSVTELSLGSEIAIEVAVKRSALLLVDNISKLETTGAGPTDDISNFFLSQGYVFIASLSSLKTLIKIPEKTQKPIVEITVDSVTLKSCADSTQVLIQTLNALKPPVESSDSVRFHTELANPVDVFSEIDETAFFGGGGSALSNMRNDIINDDLPSNLEFVESYYVDQPTRLKWNSGSSSRSLNNEFSQADLLLEQDLSVLAGRSKVSGNDVNSIESSVSSIEAQNQAQDPLFSSSSSSSSSRDASQSHSHLDSFEQRVYTYDSVLNINEDHFAKDGPIRSNEHNHSTGSTSAESSSVNTPRRRRSVTATVPEVSARIPHQPSKPQIKIRCRILSIDWLLHDGYDWEFTRDTINNAVSRVEIAAGQFHREVTGRNKLSTSDRYTPSPRHSSEGSTEERGRFRNSNDGSPSGDEIQTVVGDLLFNSIYIGVPAGDDPDMLRGAINRELNDDVSETGSTVSTSNITSRSDSTHRRRSADLGTHKRKKKLALKRSKRYKMKISLRDVCADVLVFAGVNDPIDNLPGQSEGTQFIDDSGLILNQVDIRVRDLEIFDNVHTSTWNKFLSYMRDAGERETHASMVHIQLDTVKPVNYLAVSEIQLKVSVLPLRLIVDQDALDFLTRFFEFKDERFIVTETNEEIFIQKLDIRSVSVKLDYKPKKVNYMGLKSGRTIEFMNFFTLDGADIVLRHVVLYGIDGFGRVSDLLNGIWMPDIRQNQLGKFLSGLSSVHSLVRLGSGVRDLFIIPLQEYKKDGRVVRGLQKGAWFFARNTTNELAKLGAKLAAGTQTILESAEQAMGGSGASARISGTPSVPYRSPYSDDIQIDDEEDNSNSASASEKEQERLVSLYANQPGGVSQGLKFAYESIGKNLTMAKDAVIDIGADAAERGNAQGAAIALMRAAPVVLIRPMIGATEAVSKTLLGVTNQIDPDNLQDVQDVSIIESYGLQIVLTCLEI